MIFAGLAPRVLALAALAAAAAVLALHLLRRTPRAQLVSHLEFWRRAAQHSPPKRLFAARVPWLALLVSLAVALLLVVELGEPRYGAGFSGTTVLVLAADRTMGARDERGQRRIDEAIARARAIVQTDTVSGRVAIVRAGVRAQVLVPLTQRVVDAERALSDIAVDDGSAELGPAVALARSIVRSTGAAGRVVLFADRDEHSGSTLPAPGAAAPVASDEAPVPLHFTLVGGGGETLAVTALDARRDPNALGEYDVRCEVRSYASRRATARLVLRDRDTVLSQRALTLEPGSVVTQSAHGFSSAQAELSARLEDIALEGGARDALASDDAAFATVPPVVATRVLLVTAGNRFLENALGADPTVALERATPGQLAERAGALGRYHVVVLDRVEPPANLVHPAVLWLGAGQGSGRVVRLGEGLENPRVTAFAAEHRALAGLRFDQVQVFRARALVPAAEDRVLVRSGRDALALARERGGARLVALGFDTEGTDLVQRIAFPLFVHNALVWLDRREREFRSWQTPGEPLRVTGDPALVLAPDGAAHEVRGALYDTGRAGLYHAADRATAVSAVEEAGALPQPANVSGAQRTGARLRPSLALVVAAALLALLSLEWLLLNRGRLR